MRRTRDSAPGWQNFAYCRFMIRRSFRIGVPLALIGTAGMIAASPALAATAQGSDAGNRAASAGPATTSANGNDVSYPQCGKTFPSRPAFGIVGVNGGLANYLNPCLGPSSAYPSYKQSELYWAVSAATGSTAQPKASLYLNTADPGNLYNGKPIADWPKSGSTPYGTCITTTVTTGSGTYVVGQNSPACAWQYGHDRAAMDVSWLASAASAITAQSPPVPVSGAASSYPWWLDVETANSWQTGTSGQAMNVADLQGMLAALKSAGATIIGGYSTSAQWNQVTGGTTSAAAGSLYQIPNWIPGARSLSGATANCRLPSFTGGRVTVTQWTVKATDHDHAC
jgi:hypothetical protein